MCSSSNESNTMKVQEDDRMEAITATRDIDNKEATLKVYPQLIAISCASFPDK